MMDWIRRIAMLIGTLLLAPFRALIELGGWIGWAAASNSESESDADRKPLWQRILLTPVYLVTGIATVLWQVVSYPFQGWVTDPVRRRQLLLGTPAALGFLAFIYLLAQQPIAKGEAKSLYAKAFDEAEKNKEYAKARLVAHQLLRNGARSAPEAAFRFCKMLAVDNDLDRANAVMDVLAPNNAPGYAPAHAQRAVAFAALIARGAGPQFLEPLLWHLNHSNDRRDEKLALAWATYYQASQQFPEAIRYLEIAAQTNPEHWFTIANIMVTRGDANNAQQALKLARDSFRRKLGEDPLSLPSRLRLSEALIRLQQFEDAQQTIQSGLDFYPDNAELRKANGALERTRFLAMQEEKKGDQELLEQALVIMSYPEQQDFAFDRLVNMFGRTNEDQRQRIIDALERKASDDPTNSLLQLSLSTIALIEQRKDDAIALLEKTLEIEPRLHLAKNNLAWLIAERDPSQIDRAVRLAEEAIEAVPNSPNYRDTLGTILFLKGDMERAITELERALPGMPNEERDKLYDRLAKAYESIGNSSLAETYRSKMAEESRKSKSN